MTKPPSDLVLLHEASAVRARARYYGRLARDTGDRALQDVYGQMASLLEERARQADAAARPISAEPEAVPARPGRPRPG
jgi:hypothetical protein